MRDISTITFQIIFILIEWNEHDLKISNQNSGWNMLDFIDKRDNFHRQHWTEQRYVLYSNDALHMILLLVMPHDHNDITFTLLRPATLAHALT
jgi:hypothetical protein